MVNANVGQTRCQHDVLRSKMQVFVDLTCEKVDCSHAAALGLVDGVILRVSDKLSSDVSLNVTILRELMGPYLTQSKIIVLRVTDEVLRVLVRMTATEVGQILQLGPAKVCMGMVYSPAALEICNRLRNEDCCMIFCREAEQAIFAAKAGASYCCMEVGTASQVPELQKKERGGGKSTEPKYPEDGSEVFWDGVHKVCGMYENYPEITTSLAVALPDSQGIVRCGILGVDAVIIRAEQLKILLDIAGE